MNIFNNNPDDIKDTETGKYPGETFVGERTMRELWIFEDDGYDFIDKGMLLGRPINMQKLYCNGSFLIPEIPGVYILFYDGRIVYVRMSNNIKRRLIEHYKNDLFDIYFTHVFWFFGLEKLGDGNPVKGALNLEKILINRFKPPCNSITVTRWYSNKRISNYEPDKGRNDPE